MAVSGNGTTTPAAGPHSYVNGAVVPITATPDLYWNFVDWTGDVANASSPSTNVTVDANKTVTANFERRSLTLTMAVVGSGTTTPASGSHSYVNGTEVDITAIPTQYWNFVEWTTTGDISEIDDPDAKSTTVVVDENKTVMANFEHRSYILTMAKTGGSGSISPSVGPHSYVNGTEVDITATPDPYQGFVEWTTSGDISEIDDPDSDSTTVVVDENKTVTAHFDDAYNLTVKVSPSGKGKVKVNGATSSSYPKNYTFVDDTNVTLQAVANSGYKFDEWTGDVTAAQEDDNPTYVIMDDNKTVTAKFVTTDGGDGDGGGGDDEPVADFTTNKTTGAAPLTVKFTDTSTNSPTSWSWNFGDGGTDTTQSPKHKYTATGTYTVALTATNSKGSDTETKSGYITVTSGGGGPGQYSISLNILGKAATGQMNGTGKLLQVINTTSTNGKVNIHIANGTVCHDKDGGRLTTIAVNAVGNGTNLSAPENQHVIAAYKLTPNGATFTPALDLTLGYGEEGLPEGVSEKRLYIASYNETSEKWSALKSQVNTQKNTVTVEVKHFTTFAIIGKTTSWLGKYWWIIVIGVVVAVLLLFFLWWRRREEYYY
jgi:PKD repeat protein